MSVCYLAVKEDEWGGWCGGLQCGEETIGHSHFVHHASDVGHTPVLLLPHRGPHQRKWLHPTDRTENLLCLRNSPSKSVMCDSWGGISYLFVYAG